MKENFPKQKISKGAKTIKWQKECVDRGIELCSIENPKIRQSRHNKIINYNLLNDILDERDVKRVINPFGIKGINSFPAKMQNYPICLPKIDLLVGEESKRKFEYTILAMSRDAIENKDKLKAEYIRQAIATIVKNDKGMEENKISNYLRKVLDYANYEIKDFREVAANKIMEHYSKELNFNKLFNDGFLDMLSVSEENFCIDIEANEPVIRKVSPLSITAYRTGSSPWLQDADMIKEEDYLPIGTVIDRYNDFLKPKDIDKLEARNFSTDSNTILKIRPDSEHKFMPANAINKIDPNGGGAIFDFGDGNLINPANSDASNFYGNAFDTEGNVLVTRFVWKSMRKIGFLTYFDEDGRLQKKNVDENFEVNPNLGQEITWRWVSEWWEGTKIGAGHEAIYVKMRRRPVQFRKSGNPSICHSGYVGLAYNINTNRAMSLLDRMKPLQYLYNVLMYRTELAFAKSHGKIMRLPLHEVPDGWTMDKYLAFALGQNIAPYDAFKEIKKGPATGKLAGNMQQNNHVIDMEMGSYIQQHIDMMLYIKEEVGEISGVSKSRQGQIHQRQAVGNSRTEITQSSHITERWFSTHELVRKKVYEVFLDTAIVALKKNPYKAQVILGEFIHENVELVLDELSMCEMGILVSSSSDDAELLQTLKDSSREAVQSQMIDFVELTNIFGSKSISEITRKLESSHQAKQERESAMVAEQNEAMQTIKESEIAWEKEKHYSELELEKYKIDTEAMLKEAALAETNNDSELLQKRVITLETLKANRQKIEDAYNIAMQKINIDKEKLQETVRSNKAKESIARSKPTSTAK